MGNSHMDAKKEMQYVFFAYRNLENKVILPSGKNTFDGMKYEHVMVSHGNFSVILPLPSDITLKNFVKKYSNHKWKITKNGYDDPLLVISKNKNQFPVKLSTSSSEIFLDHLNFHLHYEDTKEILELNIPALSADDKEILSQFVIHFEIRAQELPSGRREFALIGKKLVSGGQDQLHDNGIYVQWKQCTQDQKQELLDQFEKLREKDTDFPSKYDNKTGDELGRLSIAPTDFSQKNV